MLISVRLNIRLMINFEYFVVGVISQGEYVKYLQQIG